MFTKAMNFLEIIPCLENKIDTFMNMCEELIDIITLMHLCQY